MTQRISLCNGKTGLLIIMLIMMMRSTPLLCSADESNTRLWTFDSELPDMLPAEFQVGTLFDGRPAGEWKIVKTDRANSQPQVLGQLMGRGGEHAYKMVLINDAIAADVDVSVFFLPISGKGDMGGGLIWRAADDRNYYLTRANPLEQNIRIYRVTNGIRKLLYNFNQVVDVRQWHALHVIHRGCQVQVFYDKKQVFDMCDKTFTEGRIGLWTKSDAVTYFDDLRLEILK